MDCVGEPLAVLRVDDQAAVEGLYCVREFVEDRNAIFLDVLV
jgi:hypothetical protein